MTARKRPDKKRTASAKSGPKARRIRKRAPSSRDPNRCGVIEVATIIGEDYQRARQAMLKSVFGPASYDATTRRLTVARSGVSREAWHANQTSDPVRRTTAGKPAPSG